MLSQQRSQQRVSVQSRAVPASGLLPPRTQTSYQAGFQLTRTSPATLKKIVIIGGGPVGLALAISLAEEARIKGLNLAVLVYELRIENAGPTGMFKWKSFTETGCQKFRQVQNRRREEVITIRDSTASLFDGFSHKTREAFQGDLVEWDSVSLSLSDFENKLLSRVQDSDVAKYVKLEKIPESARSSEEQRVWISSLDCDLLVGADGQASIVRHAISQFTTLSFGRIPDYMVGVAFESMPGWTPQNAALSACISLSQNRYHISTCKNGGKGYISMRLTMKEYESLLAVIKDHRLDHCPHAAPLVVWDILQQIPGRTEAVYEAVPEARSVILEGLRLYGVPKNLVTSIVAHEISLTFAKPFSVSQPRGPHYCLLGDAAMSHHAWFDNGLDVGVRSAAALTTSVIASNQGGAQEQLQRFQSFMTMLYEDELEKKSALMFVNAHGPPRLPDHIDHKGIAGKQASTAVADELTQIFVERVKKWRDFKESAGWPHASLSDTEIWNKFTGVDKPAPYILKVMIDSGVEDQTAGVTGVPLPKAACYSEHGLGLGDPDTMKSGREDRERRSHQVRERLKYTEKEAQRKVAVQSSFTRLDREGRTLDNRQYYDFMLEVNCFADVFKVQSGEKGWKILKHTPPKPEDPPEVHDTRFVVMGNFKRGKTWLLQQLSGVVLPSHEVLHTPGLCAKRISIDGHDCVLLDVKGENTPLPYIDDEMFRDKKAEECFFRDIICEMADAFIYLVNQVGYDEQLTLMQLSRELELYNLSKPKSVIYMVHNFKQLQTETELQMAWQEVCKIYGSQGYQKHTTELKLPDRGGTAVVEYLTRSIDPSEKKFQVSIMHFFLGAEGSVAGANNAAVIEWIRTSMTRCVTVKHKNDLLSELTEAMTRKIPQFISTPAETYVHRVGDSLQLGFKEETEPLPQVRLRDVDLGSFVKIGREIPYPSRYRVVETKRQTLQVQIDVPGCSQEVFEELAEQIIDFDREGSGVKINFRPHLLPRPLKDGDRVLEGTPAQPLESDLMPPIVVTKRLKDWDRPRAECCNGILTVEWDMDLSTCVRLNFGQKPGSRP